MARRPLFHPRPSRNPVTIVLLSQGAPTRTGKARRDRSVVWWMLRNPVTLGEPSAPAGEAQ